MDRALEPPTSLSLLDRLRRSPTDQAAWGAFVDRYGRLIYDWCRQWRLQEADAEDVTQDVLLRIARRMQSFTYDPAGRFRGWLRTLTAHALSDFLARRKGDAGSGDSQVVGLLETVAARDDLLRRLEEEFDRELLELAMTRVRARVEARTWEAFRLLALEGRPGAEAAASLGMKVAAVFVARSRVQQMLQEEVRLLEESASEDPP
jgi:RNA polymerase sigma-70 factor (ECF subfamily)